MAIKWGIASEWVSNDLLCCMWLSMDGLGDHERLTFDTEEAAQLYIDALDDASSGALPLPYSELPYNVLVKLTPREFGKGAD